MNKNIKNNIILKTEQNSSQAHHIKHQNQNLEENTVDSDEAAWISRVCRISYCFI